VISSGPGALSGESFATASRNFAYEITLNYVHIELKRIKNIYSAQSYRGFLIELYHIGDRSGHTFIIMNFKWARESFNAL
jgi:hypothetical protein